MDTLLNARIVRQQPTVIPLKKVVSQMLTICSLFFWMPDKEN